LLIAVACGPADAQFLAEQQGSAYQVVCPEEGDLEAACRVDRLTYVGWRVFQNLCSTCHAPDAQGSRFAPDLVSRIQRMDKQAFLAAMEKGYLGVDTSMPPWGENPYVAAYYNELWSYLSARASGALPPGEPGVLPGSE